MILLIVYSVIAVHGLNPQSKDDADHALDTWRMPNGEHGRLWLRDDLPQYIPKSRIFLYEYNSTAVYGKDRGTFIDKANMLLEEIRLERRKAAKRPIIFLGHSLGGLLIKQALINAYNSSNSKYNLIKDATTGLAFFATPHDGASSTKVTFADILAKIATSLGIQQGDNIVETLKNEGTFSDIMHEQWRHRLPHYSVVSFWGAYDSVGLLAI
jgi:Putative serine esterase (DUF676)